MAASELNQICLDFLEEEIERKEEWNEAEEDFEWDQDDEYEKICSVLEHNWSFPTTPMVSLIHRKCQLEMDRGQWQKAAMGFLSSQSISFQHQALSQYSKRVIKEEESEEMQKVQMMSFKSPSAMEEELKGIIGRLPDSWRIVQIMAADSKTTRFKSTPADKANPDANLALLLIAVECGQKSQQDCVTIHKVEPIHIVAGQHPTLLSEFQDVLALHDRIYKADFDRSQYKKSRDQVDARMASLIDTIENKWLGFNKCLLLGTSIHKDRQKEIDAHLSAIESRFFQKDKDFVSSGRKKVLLKLLDGGRQVLTDDQLDKGFLYCLGPGNEELLEDLKECFVDLKGGEERHATVFILDRHVQALPWESLPCVSNQPISRVPSLPFMGLLYEAHVTNDLSVLSGVRQDKIFYVLNPDQNLAKTQKRLEDKFSALLSLGDGMVGQQPSLPQMQKVLSEMDAFMYCGHGSTLKHVPAQEIEKLNVRAVPLLFGCSSGQLQRMGRHLDPLGTVSYYFIATAPCLLGFLWPITDKDVDDWTVGFLQHWLGKGQPEFVKAVAEKRGSFTRMVNRAAAVVYGLPSSINK